MLRKTIRSSFSQAQKPESAARSWKVEGAMYASKVQLYCSKCGKGVRVRNQVVNGKKVRVCAKCGAEL